MVKTAMSILIAIGVAGPAPALASGQPARSHPQPSSYAPRPHSTEHVYGSPIEPPIVGRAHAAQHRPVPTTASAKATTRESHDREPKNRRRAAVPQRSAGSP